MQVRGAWCRGFMSGMCEEWSPRGSPIGEEFCKYTQIVQMMEYEASINEHRIRRNNERHGT